MVMTDKHRIYQMKFEYDSLCKIDRVLDFTQHELDEKIIEVANREWFNIHMTDRLFCIDSIVYNVGSKASGRLVVPRKYAF